MRRQFRAYAGEVAAGFLDILFEYAHGDVFHLDKAVCAGGFVQQNLVVLGAVHIQDVAL